MGASSAVVRATAFVAAAVVTFSVVKELVDDGTTAPFGDPAEQAAPTTSEEPPAPVLDLTPYEGLGTWVDAFDYGRAYQTEGHEPAVTPDDVEAMAEAGVRTIFLQVTRNDPRSPDGFVDREVAEELLVAAHEAEMHVVGWYLPTFSSVRTDLANLEALLELEVDGHRLDGVGVDIEYTEAVPDPAVRSARLVRLSQRLDRAAGDLPISAIVLPPVQIEVVNPAYWPSFPWAEIRPHYDVWLPMSYWTFRTPESGYRNPANYHGESVRRLEANLGARPGEVPVHGIGGIGDLATGAELLTFARTLAEQGALGGSIYDWTTLDDTNRTLLARLFADFPDVPD
ncbi:MAG TPA: hypothetical protein VD926_01310 [Acidimicrobiales bacterium]|nr:hypothetical protein [Acidimicrobiales bacterium]